MTPQADPDATDRRTAVAGTRKSATTKKVVTKKATTKKDTATTTKSATEEAAPKKTTAKKTTAKKATTHTTAARPARGAFASGAARASGERRRRSGTPLISASEPLEVSAARRRRASEEVEQVEQVAPVSPAEPPVSAVASSGSRPSRATIRAQRSSTAPGRLRAVPSADSPALREPAQGHTADTAPAPATDDAEVRETPATTVPGIATALTSGVQSRAGRLVGAVLESAEFTSDSRPGPAELVELAVNVLRAAALSSGLPAEDVERQVADALAYLRRRLTGDYVVDEFGFDEDYTLNVHLPLLRPLYRKWFRVEVQGIENIPSVGGALVVANHSGTIAMDSLMTQVAVHDEHPAGRHLRMLGADLVFTMPFVGTMARRSGSTIAANTDAERLLSRGHLVGVWPEGFKGVGKPFSERYKLQRFGRGGFVSAALRAGVPIVPCSIVGAEEIYPILGDMPAVARLLGMPYAPITPTFPWLGPLGMIPLPSKWLIEFGPPIETTSFGADAADDPMLVFDLTDQVRETIQQTLYSLLMQRKSVFF